jgi:hypothetical protein
LEGCPWLLAGTRGYSRVPRGAGGREVVAVQYGVGARGYSRCRPGTSVRGCRGTAEGPRVAVLSCAGAYVSGADGSTDCPAVSARIETEAACRTAAAAAGMTPGSRFAETNRYAPRGCYYWTFDNTAYFNTHAVGRGTPGYQLLCADLATTGAPLHAPMRRRACAACCSRAVGLIIQTA